MRWAILLAAAGVFVAAPASALTPVAQDRHVFGENEVVPPFPGFVWNETFSAPDYGPFVSGTDGYSASTPPFSPPLTGPVLASQDSQIDPDALHAVGSSLSNPGNPIGAGHRVESESLYSVSFTLDASSPYTIAGQLDLALVDCDGGASGFIRLIGSAGVLAEVAGSTSSGGPLSLPLSDTLLLDPGSYTLEARAWSEGRGADGPGPGVLCEGSASASFEVDLEPTPPVVPALPAPLVPLLGLALARAVRRRVRR